MITPSFSPTATERVLPKLALDFTTGVLDSRVTVTRALNTATCINSAGLVAVVNANLPRFDYDPVTLQPKGILIEESRTNLILQSGNCAAAPWAGDTSGGSIPVVTANYAVSPGGTTTATRVQLNRGAGTFSRWAQNLTVSSTVYIGSIWMKTTSGSGTANVGLRVGTVGVNCVVTGTWQRFQLSTSSATANPSLQILSFTAIPGTDVTADILIWGGQVEAGTFITSYIPTSATTATRNADVVAMTGSNFSSWYSSGAGAFQANLTPRAVTGTRPIIQADDNSANNLISLRQNAAATELYILSSSVTQAQINAGTALANTAYKLAGAWATNNCAAAKDGGAIGTTSSATIPSPTQLRIGNDGTNYGNIWLAKLNYWPQRITNAETQAFSK